MRHVTVVVLVLMLSSGIVAERTLRKRVGDTSPSDGRIVSPEAVLTKPAPGTPPRKSEPMARRLCAREFAAATRARAAHHGGASSEILTTRPKLEMRGGVPVFASRVMDIVCTSTLDGELLGVLGRESSFQLIVNSIHAGSEQLYRHDGVRYAPAGEGLTATRGPLVERLRSIPGGIEQLFDIASPVKGDLTFAVGVQTNLSAPENGTTGDTVAFWNGQQVGFTYGHVVTIDANGASISSLVTYASGNVTFTIPGSWLATAAYPVVVDPTVGALITLTGSPQNGPYHNNDVAYNQTADEYFAVYAETASTTNDIFGKIINANTGAVGPLITLVANANETFAPSISWNSALNRYLFVYSDIVTGDAVNEVWTVKGLVLNASGVPVNGTTPFNIASGTGSIDPFGPDVAFDGTNWLVTYFDLTNDGVAAPNTGFPNSDIMARFVPGTADNTTQGMAAPLTIANSADDEENAAVAFGAGGNYLITWVNFSVNLDGVIGFFFLNGVFGRSVTPAGVLGTITEYDDTSDTVNARTDPSVCANSTTNEFLVGWANFSIIDSTGDPMVRRISSTGTLIGGANPIAVDSDPFTAVMHTTMIWNAAMNQYLVFWFDDEGTGTLTYDLRAARLNGTTLAVVQSSFVLATMASALAGLDNPQTSGASRNGTTQVIALFRELPSDGTNLVPPFNLYAQRFDMNNPPSAPVAANLVQKQGAAATPPTDAEGVTYVLLPRQESFGAGSSTDVEAHQIRLQIERILNSASFNGTFTEQSGLVASGGSPTITVSSIPNGAYKWRARFVDELGSASNWVEFGAAGGPDHTFNVPNQLPGVPDITQNATTGQFRMNGTTQIAMGTTTPEGTVILKGSIGADADGDNVRLEVEVQPVGTPFTDVPSLTSTFGAAGVHQVSFTPVTSAAGYHWQARVRDASGAVNDTTPWVQYGGNPEPGGMDFARDSSANTTAAPAGPAQFESDGTTVIVLGGTAGSRTVVLKATTTDPEGDQYQIEVEVKPISVAFDGTITATSALFNSGTQASVSVTIPGFAPESYHWQVRTRDALSATSAFVTFGANGDAPPAGVDYGLPQVDFGGSKNNLKCGLAAGVRSIPFAIVLLVAAILLVHRRR